jgi:hypothetical protein
MIKFTKDGREIPLERFADELRDDVMHAAREGIEVPGLATLAPERSCYMTSTSGTGARA